MSRLPYRAPKPKQTNIPFSLGCLQLVAWAVDPAAVRLSRLHITKGAPLTPEDEAKALECHTEARKALMGVFEEMEAKATHDTEPTLLLAMFLQKHAGKVGGFA